MRPFFWSWSIYVFPRKKLELSEVLYCCILQQPSWRLPVCLQFRANLLFYQKVVRQSLNSCQAIVYQSSCNCQAAIRQPSGSRQAAIRQPSGSRQAAIRQPSGSHQAVVWLSWSRFAVLRLSLCYIGNWFVVVVIHKSSNFSMSQCRMRRCTGKRRRGAPQYYLPTQL